jgi:hypothetical protein
LRPPQIEAGVLPFASIKDTMTSKPASKTLSVRLTPEERLRLEMEAGSQPVSTYARSKLLGGKAASRKVRGKHAVKDHEALGRILGLLGASGITANLNALAKAVKNGALLVTPETESAICTACADIRTMHAALMQALGFRPGDNP